ncbi:MAG: hypothetical protein ACR2LP_00720, partial [Candidatus Limnocylindrales bacterium]
MRIARFALVPVATLLLAGCSSGGGATPSPPATTASAVPSAPAAATRVEVELTDALRMEPAQISV